MTQFPDAYLCPASRLNMLTHVNISFSWNLTKQRSTWNITSHIFFKLFTKKLHFLSFFLCFCLQLSLFRDVWPSVQDPLSQKNIISYIRGCFECYFGHTSAPIPTYTRMLSICRGSSWSKLSARSVGLDPGASVVLVWIYTFACCEYYQQRTIHDRNISQIVPNALGHRKPMIFRIPTSVSNDKVCTMITLCFQCQYIINCTFIFASLLHWSINQSLFWLKPDSCHDVKFVVTGVTGGCRYDNHWYHQRRQCWQHDDSRILMIIENNNVFIKNKNSLQSKFGIVIPDSEIII